MNINVEGIHSRWMVEMSSFSWRFMKKTCPDTRTEGAILYLPSEEEMESRGPFLDTKGRFLLPPGSENLIFEMARFAKCSYGELDGINGLNEEFTPVPEALFCLHSLLLAAFPKNLETDVFRPNDCSDSLVSDVLDYDPELVKFQPYNAFGGLGIILMNETRKILSPISPDVDILKMTNGLFLGVFSKSLSKVNND